MNNLKFPIGDFILPVSISDSDVEQWISEIESFPDSIFELTSHLAKQELNWRYRPEGWTIKQVVHHCSDSHINSVIRFKLALTEDNPTIRPYHEERWAELSDSLNDDIQISLKLIESLHSKWVYLLRSLNESQLNRTFTHPDSGAFLLKQAIAMYAWHSNHHLAHIKQALASKGMYN